MKRGLYLTVILLSSLLLINTAISAETTNSNSINQAADKILEDLITIAEKLEITALLENIHIDIEINELIKYLYGVLLFLLIYNIIDMINFFENKKEWLKILLSFAITFLSIIALPTGFIEFLIPSYKSMASAILTMIPFLIVLYISVKTKKQIWARLLWVFVIVLCLVLFIEKGIPAWNNSNYIDSGVYLLLALISLIIIIFMPAIRRFVFSGELKDLENEMKGTLEIEQAVKKSRLSEAKSLRELSRT